MKEPNGDNRNTEVHENDGNPMRILEDALVLCKFGRFNVKLMVVSLVSVLATTTVTTSTSYILSSAECDLSLTMMHKGVLNAAPFLGQICACVFTGFVTDAFGRKFFLVYGNFILFLCALLGGSSQSFWMLCMAKLFEGIAMSVCFTATPAMISELTHRDVRDRMLLLYSSFMSMSIIVAALLAWGILPLKLDFVIYEGYIGWLLLMILNNFPQGTNSECSKKIWILYGDLANQLTDFHTKSKFFFENSLWVPLGKLFSIMSRSHPKLGVVLQNHTYIHSWNIYLYVSAVWSLVAAVTYWQLPESPKFLLSHGQENEALEILKDIYCENTGKGKDTFPITSLNISGVYKPTCKISFKKKITDALFETKKLFQGVLLMRLLLFSSVIFVCLLTYSALRLWYPQLSTMIENYEKLHEGTPVKFCAVLDEYNDIKVVNISAIQNVKDPNICVPQLSGYETYTNGIMLGAVSLACVGLSVYMVDFIGPKWLSFIFFMLCAGSSVSLYWANSSIQIAILISATCGFIQTAFSVLNSIMVRVFPTTLRTMTLSLILMIGRVGSLSGNLLFPMMLQRGCMAPFIILSSTCVCVGGIIYFIPDANKENSGTGDK